MASTTNPSSSSLTATTVTTTHHPKPLRPEDDLPTNVHRIDQLALLPMECLNQQDPDKIHERPLRHIDLQGHEFHYALDPMRYAVGLILVVELMERFTFYGVYYTQTLYLTGVYNAEWNPGLTSVDAASFVSISTAVAYTTPFVGALLADAVWGDYYTIVGGCLALYLPALILVAMTTVPGLLGEEFNSPALSVALLCLWPMGTGIVKSVVNVFGARQFHPFLQSSMIESYYVNFYASINIGALLGILVLPVLAQRNVTVAYSIPVVLLAAAVALFVLWTPRFVRGPPAHTFFPQKSLATTGRNHNGTSSSTDSIPLTTMFRIALLIVPFCIAYSQMPTTFIVQGTVMKKAFGFIDAATINLIDTVSVLVFGYLTGTHLYPALARHNIKMPTTYKFALGSFLGVLSILWALFVEHKIHATFHQHHNAMNHDDDPGTTSLNILWQAPSYVLIGAGEIFAVSAAYEVAFTASSPQTKVLASAMNIFCVGGIPNAVCIFLYQACRGWFRNTTRGDTNISRLEDYVTAHVAYYFWVLVVILCLGVTVNLWPSVREMVDSTEKRAAEIVKTPLTPFCRHPRDRRAGGGGGEFDEETPLLRKKILLAKEPPVLNKMGSMREGPKIKTPKKIKAGILQKLYRSGSPVKTRDQNNNDDDNNNSNNDDRIAASRRLIQPRAFQHAESR